MNKKNIFFFKISFYCKKFFFFLISLFFFIFLFSKLIKSLIVINKNLDKHVYYQPEGGFGFTISSPLYLESKFNKDWLLLFAYNKKRHNIYIEKLFPNNFFFVKISIFEFVINTFFRKLFFKILSLFSKVFLKKTIYDFIDKLFLDNPISNDQLTNEYYKRYESRCWPELIKNRNKFNFNHLNEGKKNFLDFFCLKNIKKRVCFFLRYKANKENFTSKNLIENPLLDIPNILRDSRPIEDYKFIIKDLVEKEYQVFITGDNFHKHDWIKKFGNEVVYYDKYKNINKNYYDFFAGFSSDIIIGQASGGFLYCMLNKKNLLLETFEIGTGLNHSIVSYPYLKIKNSNELKKIVFDEHFKFDPEFFSNNSKISQLSLEQLNSIYLDYIDNYSNDEYGIKPQKFGIDKGQLIETNSKFSPKWLEIIGM